MTNQLSLELRGRGDSVLILLPGAQMHASEFVEAGFINSLSASSLALDLQIVNIDLTQISALQAMQVIQETVLQPARQRYKQLLLGGISLGGQAALLQAARQRVTLDGLCLLAPYPGSRLAMNAIERAGGVENWQMTEVQREDPDFWIWEWLRQPHLVDRTFIGYGCEDRFCEGIERIAQRFALRRRCVVEGGHDWPTWTRLWAEFIHTGALLHLREVDHA